MKCLLLLRHGEAEPTGAAAGDFERPLTPHGRAQAQHAAHCLRRTHCLPETILASPALRARETATIVAALLTRLQALRYDTAAYPGSAEALLQLVRSLPEASDTLLLVSHNPGLTTLANEYAAHLHTGQSGSTLALATGGLCRIDFAGSSWSSVDSGATDVTLLS
ncbi:MAG TPA: histidine phosphatase family protein [Steroidobacteraceae bacterium]|nr:histidine phosphatase family protein [Steroidobacteraceae bacterium]